MIAPALHEIAGGRLEATFGKCLARSAAPLVLVLLGACAKTSTHGSPGTPSASVTEFPDWAAGSDDAPAVVRDRCYGVVCAAPSRCIVMSSGARCIERPEDAVPWWPDDACDKASCPTGSFCSLTGTGFECIRGQPCRTVTDGGSPECFPGQQCISAATCGLRPCSSAATPFCAFPPPEIPNACEQYMSSATACLPADLKEHLEAELGARMKHRLGERADGATRDRLQDDCWRALMATSNWCLTPD